ncbi:MAG: SDR family oxidoreductase [Actinomycetia bacterium]|nr:SDR family oxidoreductase [Actinomycetes bacterium]
MAALSTLGGAFDLTGQVALVTGAGSETGIGFASARLLGAAGARVAVTSTTARIEERVGQLQDVGVKAFGVPADLTDSSQATMIVESALQRFGQLDIVVNNAGMTSVADPTEGHTDAATMSDDAWRAGVSRNLDTAFFVTRAALRPMLAAGYGRVVNVASITGPVMAMVGNTDYGAAKAGMVGMTRSIAVEVARSGITVNAVCPGWIATASQTADEYQQGLRTPVGRSATANEIASAVLWLATPGAAYVTGQAIVVDGGNSIAEERR